MNTAMPELFTPFLDPVDMVVCCPAETPLAEVQRQAAAHGLRFPLAIEPAASIAAHLAAAEYSSGSARFGPYADNVLGMNWRLPGGRVVRIGERVIKSTTGYDLLRFLLHSDGRYGRALDYVLRLRPAGGEHAHCALQGDAVALARARSLALHSPWIHWIDICDLEFGGGTPPRLRLVADCAPGESAAFEIFFRELERQSGARRFDAPPPPAQLPSLGAKCTASLAVDIAEELVRRCGGTATVLCASGAVHLTAPPDVAPSADVLDGLARTCSACGGHLYGRRAPAVAVGAAEEAWSRTLESSWNRI